MYCLCLGVRHVCGWARATLSVPHDGDQARGQSTGTIGAASPSGSGTEVGGHEFSSESPTLGARHEGRPPVLTRSDRSCTASASGSATSVGRHEFGSVAMHEGESAVPAYTSTESSTSTEFTESIESACQTDISGTERIPPYIKLYDFEYFGKLSDALLQRFPRNAIHDFTLMLRDKVLPGTKEVELQCILNIIRGVKIGQRLLAHRIHE